MEVTRRAFTQLFGAVLVAVSTVMPTFSEVDVPVDEREEWEVWADAVSEQMARHADYSKGLPHSQEWKSIDTAWDPTSERGALDEIRFAGYPKTACIYKYREVK